MMFRWMQTLFAHYYADTWSLFQRWMGWVTTLRRDLREFNMSNVKPSFVIINTRAQLHIDLWVQQFVTLTALLFNWKYFWGWNLVRTTCGQHKSEISGEISLADAICYLHVIHMSSTHRLHIIHMLSRCCLEACMSSAQDGNSSA